MVLDVDAELGFVLGVRLDDLVEDFHGLFYLSLVLLSPRPDPEEGLEVVVGLVGEDLVGVLLLEDEVDLVAVELGSALRLAAHQAERHVAALRHPDGQAVVARRLCELN